MSKFDPNHLQHMADALQTWIDWEEREGPVEDDKHIMSPPSWPSLGQIKLWIRTLETAKSQLEDEAA